MDNDFDEEGKAVILDLHGGELDNVAALQEFQEIKDAVMKEVNHSLHWHLTYAGPNPSCANRGYLQIVPMALCGENTRGEYFWQCRHRRLRSW